METLGCSATQKRNPRPDSSLESEVGKRGCCISGQRSCGGVYSRTMLAMIQRATVCAAIAGACGFIANLPAADTVYSGPQPGERTTPFKVVEMSPTGAGKERDPIAESQGQPMALVFVHGIERSL